MDKVKELQKMIDSSKNIVFFGGAGVSTESGIPDFRSADGLYNQTYKYPPEKILSHDFFISHTSEFFRFYKDKILYLDAKPNEAHKKLAELEKNGKNVVIVTQNIDGLHQAAGSSTVYELHGSVLRNNCMKCHKAYDAQYIKESEGVPTCECGGMIKPDVVLYEEMLDDMVISRALSSIVGADMLIVGGTSLAVYPAAGLIDYYNGNRLVLINKTPTAYDKRADLVIADAIGDVFSKLE